MATPLHAGKRQVEDTEPLSEMFLAGGAEVRNSERTGRRAMYGDANPNAMASTSATSTGHSRTPALFEGEDISGGDRRSS